MSDSNINPVERGCELAAMGKRDANDGYVIIEKVQALLREKKLLHTWQAKPFFSPSFLENPAGRVFSDRELALALIGLVKPAVRTQLLKELKELRPELIPESKPDNHTSALDRAIAAIKADPTKSNRLISKEIGVGVETVRRARADGSVDGSVDIRTGADGRRRKLPKAANDDRDEADPRSARIAFALRADAAWQLANYPVPVTEIDEDCRKIVEAAAKSWAELAQKLREVKS